MVRSTADSSSLRFELKLLDYLPTSLIGNELSWVKQYDDRYVTSFYHDTQNLDLLRRGLDGFENRFICRYRVYDSLDPSSEGNLEIKYTTEAGDKKSIIPSKYHQVGQDILASVGVLTTPNVCVNYRRTYLIEERMGIRLTIDRELRFFEIKDHLLIRPKSMPNTLVEIKGPVELKNVVMQMCGFNSEVRFSKYGSAALSFGLLSD